MGGYLNKKETHVSAGRFNAGQKVFYWFNTIFSLVIIVTGYILMFPGQFSIPALLWANNIHGLSSVILIAAVLGHAYLGSFANPGTIGIIWHGKVAKEWVKVHHPNWQKEK